MGGGVVAFASAGAGGRRGFADAVEVVGLGAVFPVNALGGAELLGSQLGDGLACIGCRVRGFVVGRAVGHTVCVLAFDGGFERRGG